MTRGILNTVFLLMITSLTITSNVIHSQVQLKAAWFKLEVKSRKNEKVSSTPPHQTSFDHDAIILDNTPPPRWIK